MPTETLERLPNTVTKCHAEILRLRAGLFSDPGEGAARISELEGAVADLEAELSETKERLEATDAENSELEAKVKELEDNAHPDAELAIESFLDECERVGPLRFDVPQTDRANRAIVALHDAVGRHP